jgi:hypothetical protein
MEDVTVSKILSEVVESICDEYCKYPEQYKGDNEDDLYSEHCDKCPLNKLI